MGACISSPQKDDHRRSQPSSSGSSSHKQAAAPCGGGTGGGGAAASAAASAAAAAAKNGDSKLPSLQQQWLALHDTDQEQEKGREKKGPGKSTRKVKPMSREAKGEIILAADLELARQVEGLTGRTTESSGAGSVGGSVRMGDLCCVVHSQQGRKGANQDRALAWQGFLPGAPDAVMCAVFDGHGPCGETVARIARDLLPHRIAHAVACRSPPHARSPAVAAAGATADLFTELHHHRQLQHRLSFSREEAARIYPQPADGGDSSRGENGESRRISCGSGSSSSNSSDAERSSGRPGAVVAAADSMLLQQQQQQQQQWATIMTEAFAATDADIRLHPGGNPIISGSTAAVIVRQGRTLVVAHVGDSRIVLFRRSGQQQPVKAGGLASADAAEAALSSSEGVQVSQQSGDSEEEEGAHACSAARREVPVLLTPLLLTDDHKCSVAAEKARLTAAGARVKAFPDEPHIQRIFLPDQDAPGLAVSRAFGDAMLKRFGVSVEPAVSVRHIADDDVALVAASDGVWDVLSHEDVAGIVAASPSGGETAEAIVEAAVAAWARKFPKAARDDCTAAVLFLSSLTEADAQENR